MKKSIILMCGVALAFSACQSKAAPEKVKADVDSQVVNNDPVPEPLDITAVDTTGYKTTETGLKYKVVKEGKGLKPGINDIVLVNYEGKHMDGRVFDSSIQHGEPTSFPLNAVIKGWGEGLQLMAPGAVYEFIIPSNLAYGPQGTPGGPIKPDETLYFYVELVKVGE